MGHYDSSYAADEFHTMQKKKKSTYHTTFDKLLEKNGEVWGTYDSVDGWVLVEYAEKNNYKINKIGSSCFTVTKE